MTSFALALQAVLPKAYLLAGLVSCDPVAVPEVAIVFSNQPPAVTNTLNHEDLGKFKTATQFSHSPDEIFLTGGITESNITTSFDLSFRKSTNMLTGKTCIGLQAATITVAYAPVVHIASNYKPGSCRYNTTWLHELKHVNTDVITIKEYLPHIQSAGQTAVKGLRTEGPLLAEDVEDGQKAMSGHLTSAVQTITAQMEKMRMQRQQTIDTRTEYLRLSKQCENEPL